MEEISAGEAFSQLARPHRQDQLLALDVRSEAEFERSPLYGATNIPILIDSHRSQVGLKYKQEGQEEAIKLGHQLVCGPFKEALVQNWMKAFQRSQGQGFVFCWRGGLRSGLSQEWLKQSGIIVPRVHGGYKAMRAVVLETLERPYPLLLLGGATGTGKTRLLQEMGGFIDLEALAGHRGSAFGLKLGQTQPSQTGFENRLAQELVRSTGTVLLEDESRLIGRLSIPEPIYRAMTKANMVLIQEPLGKRSQAIYEEYVQEPLRTGWQSQSLHRHLSACLQNISKRLGGLLHQEVQDLMTTAFATREAHQNWITQLLENYYDKLYAYSLKKRQQKVLFQGNLTECRDFIQATLRGASEQK